MNHVRTENSGLSKNERLTLCQKPNLPKKYRKSSSGNVMEDKLSVITGSYQDHYDKKSKDVEKAFNLKRKHLVDKEPIDVSTTSHFNIKENNANEYKDYDEPLTPARPVPGRSTISLHAYKHVTIKPERKTKITEIL